MVQVPHTLIRLASTGGAAMLAVLGVSMLAPASAQQLQPFRIGSQTPPIFEYMYINYAIEGGFLRKEGIDAKFVGFTAGLTTTQALAGGSLDAACDGLTGTLSAIERGSPAKVVYSVNADNTYVIVARDNISKAEDLRGKKWAITQMGAISQTYAALWLSKNGLPEGSVDWIPIGGTAARARAVLANQVDVTLLTAGEWMRIKEQKGVRLLATVSESVPPLPLNLCVVTAKLINERPAVVQGFVTGMLNAVRHARTPEGKQEYIKLARQVDPAGYTDKQYEELYDFYFGPKGNASRGRSERRDVSRGLRCQHEVHGGREEPRCGAASRENVGSEVRQPVSWRERLV